MMGDAGWTPGAVRRDNETIRLYNQIVRMVPESVTRQVYEYDRDHETIGMWSLNLRSILGCLGKLEEWRHDRCINIRYAEKTLMEMYETVWKSEIVRQPKLQTMCCLKEQYQCENHLTANLTKEQ